MSTPTMEPARRLAADIRSLTFAFEPLAKTIWEPCDGHETPGVQALVAMIVPSGKMLMLCGNCARAYGYEHTKHDHGLVENRAKGSDH